MACRKRLTEPHSGQFHVHRQNAGAEPKCPATTVDPIVESVAIVQPVDPRKSTRTGKQQAQSPRATQRQWAPSWNPSQLYSRWTPAILVRMGAPPLPPPTKKKGKGAGLQNHMVCPIYEWMDIAERSSDKQKACNL